MKLEIRKYEVEINANGLGLNKVSTRVDTQYFLNKVSLAFDMAAKKFRDDGCPALAEEYSEMAVDVYNYLKEIGFYD